MIFVKLPAWQLFLLIITPLFLSANLSNYLVKIILDITVYFVIFLWYLFVGREVNDRLPEDKRKSDLFFQINCLYMLVFFSLSAVMGDSFEGENMPVYILLLVLYLAFSFIYVVGFLAKTFESMQSVFYSRKPPEYSSLSIFFFFLIFIIGLWFIQPKINEFVKEN
jgi:hypothetical protein